MRTIRRHMLWMLPVMILLLGIAGCSEPDERLVKLAEKSCERQAEQNQTIARQTEQATELSDNFIDAEKAARQELLKLQQQLVEADAAAREDLQTIHQDIVRRDAECRRNLDQRQREAQAAMAARARAIDHQRDQLEQERRDIADKRQRAPVIAASIQLAGGLIACLLPLGVVVYLLYAMQRREDTDPVMVELLVEELTAERPKLLAAPSQAALPHDPSK